MKKRNDITKTKIELEPYQILLRPIVTEKGYAQAEHENIYYFEVNKLANKTQVKGAVEFLFDVRVLEVRTQNRRGKKRRYRRVVGQLRSWKKALIKLHPEDKINFF